MLNNVAVIFFFFCFTVSVKNISCVCQSGLAISSLLLATLCCGIYTTKMFEKPQKAGMLDHILSVIQACMTTCFFFGPKSVQKHKKAKHLGVNVNLELSKDSVLHTWQTIFCFMTGFTQQQLEWEGDELYGRKYCRWYDRFVCVCALQ